MAVLGPSLREKIPPYLVAHSVNLLISIHFYFVQSAEWHT